MRNKIIILSAILCLLALNVLGQNDAPLSTNAPKDKPVDLINSEQAKEFDKQIAPYVAQARKTLPEAKQKFSKGLNKDEAFFITTRIFDKSGLYEQVFVRVKSWEGEDITGTISNDLNVVKEYKPGQLIKTQEKDILDWLITKPDGSEEGNFVGKYLDTVH